MAWWPSSVRTWPSAAGTAGMRSQLSAGSSTPSPVGPTLTSSSQRSRTTGAQASSNCRARTDARVREFRWHTPHPADTLRPTEDRQAARGHTKQVAGERGQDGAKGRHGRAGLQFCRARGTTVQGRNAGETEGDRWAQRAKHAGQAEGEDETRGGQGREDRQKGRPRHSDGTAVTPQAPSWRMHLGAPSAGE